MFRPCIVCSHAQRFEIDWRLSHRVISVTQIAREYGVSRDSLRSHRADHLPACMARFQAWADTGKLIGKRRRVCELATNALGALAEAEGRALTAHTNPGPAAPAVSMTTIARKVREGRAGLDQLARLAADAAEHEDQQTAETTERIERLLREQIRIANETPPSDHGQ